MKPDQFRSALDALGLTQTAVATLLGVDPRTARRWATGERRVSPPAARFLRHLVAAQGKPNKTRKAKGSKAKGRAGPTFVARFSDGEITRMSTFTPLENLDVGRGLRLARAAYEARARRSGGRLPPVPPPIVHAHFERDGETLATYDEDALRFSRRGGRFV
jgi:transcriptional regulator with XRE-family HTH domain